MSKKTKRSARGKLPSFAMELPNDLTDQIVTRLRELPSSVKTDYLVSEVLSKFVSEKTDSAADRRSRAIDKWLETERRNEVTNDRIVQTDADFQILPHLDYSVFVDRCRDIISDIIGDVPPIECLLGTFSGGASTSRCRTKSHPAFKYLGKAHATSRALDLFSDFVAEMVPGWLLAGIDLKPEVVPGNVLFTVPKKTDIDRAACKEPDLNMFMQKGLGDFIRKRLRRVGINLNDQKINRSLAHSGSVTDKLATIDLSSASDSVTYELVALLLPECWFTLLDTVRCPVTIIDGEEHSNHMFSSMGNGFTFELETLLFYALSKATAYFRGSRGVVSIYGDDIIYPTDSVGYLTYVLNYFGFQVNPDKSHVSGPFRESCGGHYYRGLDITPFYIKKPVVTMLDLIHVANRLREWGTFKEPVDYFRAGSVTMSRGGTQFSSQGSPLPWQGIIDPSIEDTWLWLKEQVPFYLWGGTDTSNKYQLVSNDRPMYRIQEETVRRKTGIGGFLQWLNTTRDRAGTIFDGVSTSSRTKGVSKYRLRPALNSAVTQLSAHFYHEVALASEQKVSFETPS